MQERHYTNSTPSARELAIRGFCKRFAELVSEGDYNLADYIAGQAISYFKLSDEEFLLKFKDSD